MLKQLKLRKDLELKRNEIFTLETRKKDFETRGTELELSLREAKTDEDFKLVSESIDALDEESGEEDITEKLEKIKVEIKKIEDELKELDNKEQEAAKPEERGDYKMNKYQVRELMKTGDYYERSEVRDFYDKFRNLRAVGGSELTIPNVVVNRIMEIMGDYSTLYPLVDKIKVKGTTRILIDTDTTAATWIEQTGTIPTGEVGTVTDISFDGYKIGKVTFVDNSMLQDSIINVDDYVTKKIARAIALGLDVAILKGTGSGNKQPDGIIPKLPADHIVTVMDSKGYADIVKPIGLIDTGADSIGEIIAVMKRSTYYNRLLQYSVQPTSTGEVVAKLPNLRMPDLLGLRVVFNNNMDEDKILYGDFSKYTLVERESITIDKSEHVKFAEDQMGFRGKGRFDGRPTDTKAFILVTIAGVSSKQK